MPKRKISVEVEVATTPTCHYYRDLPCARPEECGVHGIVLKRESKKRHLLRPETTPQRWDPEGPKWLVTLCGEYLHPKIDFEEELAKRMAPYAHLPQDKERWNHEFEAKMDIERNTGWCTPPMPNYNPAYAVFVPLGSESGGETLVTMSEPTCKKCMVSKEKYPLLFGYNNPITEHQADKRRSFNPHPDPVANEDKTLRRYNHFYRGKDYP